MDMEFDDKNDPNNFNTIEKSPQYCPAGKCECVHFRASNSELGLGFPACCAPAGANREVRLPVDWFEVCPYPSKMQAPKKDPIEELMKELLDTLHDIYVDRLPIPIDEVKKTIKKHWPKPSAHIEALAEEVLANLFGNTDHASEPDNVFAVKKALKKRLTDQPAPKHSDLGQEEDWTTGKMLMKRIQEQKIKELGGKEPWEEATDELIQYSADMGMEAARMVYNQILKRRWPKPPSANIEALANEIYDKSLKHGKVSLGGEHIRQILEKRLADQPKELNPLGPVFKALGWQGGTIHQVIEEIKKLKAKVPANIEALAEEIQEESLKPGVKTLKINWLEYAIRKHLIDNPPSKEGIDLGKVFDYLEKYGGELPGVNMEKWNGVLIAKALRAAKIPIKESLLPVDVEKVWVKLAELCGGLSPNKKSITQALEAGRVPIQKAFDVDKAWEHYRTTWNDNDKFFRDDFIEVLKAGGYPVEGE